MPRILIGTSGFAYKEWKGIFYPEKLPQKDYLPFYAQHFSTTEINNTFYRIPSAKVTAGWREQVPEEFWFTLKLSQRITHMKKLKNVDEEMEWFFNGASGLEEKLGPILVQLPGTFRKDAGLLGDFLSRFAPRGQLAFEFRHASWMDDEVFSLLREHRAALGVVEGEDLEPVREVTGPFVYMRMRKGEYAPGELAGWAQWIRSQTADVYCYLKHDVAAPVLAKALVEELGKP